MKVLVIIMTEIKLNNNLLTRFKDLSVGSFFIYDDRLYFKLDADKNGDFSYNAVSIDKKIVSFFDEDYIVTEVKNATFNY